MTFFKGFLAGSVACLMSVLTCPAYAQTSDPQSTCPVDTIPIAQPMPTGLEHLEGRPLTVLQAQLVRERLAALGDAVVIKCIVSPGGSSDHPVAGTSR